ncbi:serine protease [Rhodobacteraceae bacterium]|nr:serine protease [Paracoccaceae bacterium]
MNYAKLPIAAALALLTVVGARTADAQGFTPRSLQDPAQTLTREVGKSRAAELRSQIPRIINGDDAATGEFPHQVSLLEEGNAPGLERHFCGGSIIGTDTILTAAHCVTWFVGVTDFVRVGAGHIDLDQLTEHEIAGVWIHPFYDDITLDFDFAIIKTRTNFFDPAIKLIDANENQTLGVGDLATITGWGVNENGEIQQVLQKAEVNVVARTDCNSVDAYDGMVSGRMICLASPGKDACQGDSGGPAIATLEGSDEPILFGTTSWGFGCAEPEFPGVYSRVISVRDWIDSIL